jgi:hypothetical protein
MSRDPALSVSAGDGIVCDAPSVCDVVSDHAFVLENPRKNTPTEIVLTFANIVASPRRHAFTDIEPPILFGGPIPLMTPFLIVSLGALG